MELHDYISTPAGFALYEKARSLFEETERNHSHIINVNGISMCFLDFGPQDGVPLIWAHGSCSTRYEIFNVQAGLVNAGYRVIGIDYRGHGRTQFVDNGYNSSLYHIADDILALMEHLSIDKAVIGGLSKGGWVATAFYDAYPARVLGLLLEDGGSFSNLELAEGIQLGTISPGQYPISSMKAVEHLSSAIFADQFEGVQAVLAGSTSILSPERKQSIEVELIAGVFASLRKTEDGWVYHCDPQSLMVGEEATRDIDSKLRADGSHPFSNAPIYSRMPLMQRTQELMMPEVIFRNLDVPIHIIDPDSPTDWIQARRLNQKLQSMHPELIEHEVYDYEHSPHEAHFERPDRFVESATTLLRRVLTIRSASPVEGRERADVQDNV